jgi:hypothetical protein
LVAVADVEAVASAVAPNGMLHEPRKILRKAAVECGRVDFGRDRPNDVGATAKGVAAKAIGVRGTKIGQNAGTMQKVVNQGIDGDHAFAGLEPVRPIIRGPEQKSGERHGEDFVGDAVDIAERTDQLLLAVSGEIRLGGNRNGVRDAEAVIDPADQVAFGNVTDKKKKAVGRLVEPTVTQLMPRHRAGIDMVGLRATEAALVVSAAVIVPIGLKQSARRTLSETRPDFGPGDVAVLANVPTGHLVGNSLIAECAQQPIKYLGRIPPRHRLNDTGSLRISVDVLKKGQRSRQTANTPDQISPAINMLRNIVGVRAGLICPGLPNRFVGLN